MLDSSAAARRPAEALPQGSAAGSNVFRDMVAQLAGRVLDDLDELDRSLKTEAIHDSRVDITTLRDALAALPAGLPTRRIKTLRQHLKWLKYHLAAAREWAVFIDKHKLYHNKLHANGAMQLIAANSHALHLKALGEVALALRSRQGAALRHSLTVLHNGAAAGQRKVASPPEPEQSRRVRKAAAKVLDAQLARVRKQARHLDDLELGELHRLRIEVRRLRHMSELLQPLFDAPAGACVKTLTDLQSTLGSIQDGVSAERLVSALTDRMGDEAQAAGSAIGLKSRSHRKRLRKRLGKQWQAFKAIGPFWMPADRASR